MAAAGSPPYRIDPLGGHHDRSAFSCRVESLDRRRRRIANCFVLTTPTDPSRILGYYTLSAASIVLTDLPPSIVKRLPHYPVIPAALLGRLAVDHRYRGQRLGELLLFNALARIVRSEIATYAVLVDPIDEDAERFYARYRFRRFSSRSSRMFLPVSDAAGLFTE